MKCTYINISKNETIFFAFSSRKIGETARLMNKSEKKFLLEVGRPFLSLKENYFLKH